MQNVEEAIYFLLVLLLWLLSKQFVYENNEKTLQKRKLIFKLSRTELSWIFIAVSFHRR